MFSFFQSKPNCLWRSNSLTSLWLLQNVQLSRDLQLQMITNHKGSRDLRSEQLLPYFYWKSLLCEEELTPWRPKHLTQRITQTARQNSVMCTFQTGGNWRHWDPAGTAERPAPAVESSRNPRLFSPSRLLGFCCAFAKFLSSKVHFSFFCSFLGEGTKRIR